MLKDIIGFILDLLPFSRDDGLFDGVQQKIDEDQATVDSYRALVKLYADMLDDVFHGITSIKQYEKPDHWLSLSYNGLIEKLEFYQKHFEVLKKLPAFDFGDYPNLEVNAERMIQEYPEKRSRVQNYLEHVENLFYYICKMEGDLSESMELDIAYDRDLIQQHKEKRGIQSVHGNNISPLKFTAHTSARKQVFMVLYENMDTWISVREIMRKARIKKDLHAIIHQLREEIVRQDVYKSLSIENNKKGAYRLHRLAS